MQISSWKNAFIPDSRFFFHNFPNFPSVLSVSFLFSHFLSLKIGSSWITVTSKLSLVLTFKLVMTGEWLYFSHFGGGWGGACMNVCWEYILATICQPDNESLLMRHLAGAFYLRRWQMLPRGCAPIISKASEFITACWTHYHFVRGLWIIWIFVNGVIKKKTVLQRGDPLRSLPLYLFTNISVW